VIVKYKSIDNDEPSSRNMMISVCISECQAEDVLKTIAEMRGPIDELEKKVVGKTRVLLDGNSKSCRRRECNMGNLICDSMLDYVRFFIKVM